MDKVSKRTLKDIDSWLPARKVFEIITADSWPYKTNVPFYTTRDKALMAIDFIGEFRNHEILKCKLENAKSVLNKRPLKKSNFSDEKAWLILEEGYIGKRSKRTIAKYGSRVTTREPIRFPKFQHPLQPFTDLVLEYLELLEENQILFAFGPRRHHQIVYHCTGKWVHWLRAMGENWYGHNVFRNDPVNLAKFTGVVNVQSVMPYVGFDEESYIERLKKTSFQDRK